MFTELEKLGYPPLMYEISGFLLRSIINARKPVNAATKPVNVESKPVNVEPKPVNEESKPVNAESKPVNVKSKPVNAENEFENRIYSLIKTQKNKTQKNILNIYRNFYNIEFDYKDVMETLRCSASTSGELLRKLKHLDLIIKTNKSKYKFNNSFNNKNIL